MTSAARLLATLDRIARRRRLAAALEGGRRWGRRALWIACVALGLTAVGVLPTPGGVAPLPALFATFLLGAAAIGAGLAARRADGPGAVARALDREAGWEGLAAAAHGLALGDPPAGRLAGAVLEDAAARVQSLAPERAGPLPRPPWRLLGLALLIALLLGILPQGGFGLLPGWGGGFGRGSRGDGLAVGTPEPGKGTDTSPDGDPSRGGEEGPVDDPPPAPGVASAVAAGDHPSTGDPPPPPDAAPPAEPPAEDPSPPAPERAVESLRVDPSRARFPGPGDVTVLARARGGPGAAAAGPLDLQVSLDGGEPRGTGVRWTLPPGGDAERRLLLVAVGGLAASLRPGRHAVRVHLRDGAGREVARSQSAEFEIEGDAGGEGAAGAPPPEAPPPPGRSEPPEPEPAAPPPAGGGGAGPEEAGAPGLPPSAFEDVHVLPLFRDGPEAVKRGPVLVVDPDGARGAPPRTVPPEEVIRRVRAAAEDAARIEGLRAADRESVRRYFEALRALLEGGR